MLSLSEIYSRVAADKMSVYNFVYRMLSIVARHTFPKIGFVKICPHKVRHVIA
jgi:hypothetical protein